MCCLPSCRSKLFAAVVLRYPGGADVSDGEANTTTLGGFFREGAHISSLLVVPSGETTCVFASLGACARDVESLTYFRASYSTATTAPIYSGALAVVAR